MGRGRTIPESDWYIIINDLKEVFACSIGPGKETAMRELRNFRRRYWCDGPFVMITREEAENDPNLNWYP